MNLMIKVQCSFRNYPSIDLSKKKTTNKPSVHESEYSDTCLNPLSPDINMHILHTVLHMFLMIPLGRIC